MGFQWLNFIENFSISWINCQINSFRNLIKYKAKSAYRYKFEFYPNKKYYFFLKDGWMETYINYLENKKEKNREIFVQDII
jgi:hypothetical protein